LVHTLPFRLREKASPSNLEAHQRARFTPSGVALPILRISLFHFTIILDIF